VSKRLLNSIVLRVKDSDEIIKFKTRLAARDELNIIDERHVLTVARVCIICHVRRPRSEFRYVNGGNYVCNTCLKERKVKKL